MIAKEKARQLRRLIERTATALSDTDALTAPELFPLWKIQQYEVGDRVRYEDTLYKCLQSHMAQADWTPDVAVSLWVKVDDPSIEFPDWHQPSGAQDAYMKGDKVTYEEKHYISDVDNNVWRPDVYGWSEVA